MIEQLESELREALAERAARIPPHASARLRQIDYHPRTKPVWPRVAVGSLAGAAATTATILAAAGPGTTSAFAGWTPSPTTPTDAQAAGEAACKAPFAPHPTPALPLVLTDVRGPFTVAIEADANTTIYCWKGPSFAGGFVTLKGTKAPRTPPSPGAIEVGVLGGHNSPPGGQPFALVAGRAGAGVSAIVLTLDDGTPVRATTANGWFAAWWPGSQHLARAEVTSTTGVSTQRLGGSSLPAS